MRSKSTSARYAVAVVAVCAAFAVRYGLHGTLENRIPFAFFTLATLIAAWYGGLGPGLLAAVGGLTLTDYFFLPPHSPDGGLGETERTSIGIYALTNTFIVVLFWHLHTRLREMEDRLHELEGGAPSGTAVNDHPGAPGHVRPL
jgi:K+-sensing histidine kinase KdpD